MILKVDNRRAVHLHLHAYMRIYRKTDSMQPPAPRAALARARRVRGYGLGEGVAGCRYSTVPCGSDFCLALAGRTGSTGSEKRLYMYNIGTHAHEHVHVHDMCTSSLLYHRGGVSERKTWTKLLHARDARVRLWFEAIAGTRVLRLPGTRVLLSVGKKRGWTWTTLDWFYFTYFTS